MLKADGHIYMLHSHSIQDIDLYSINDNVEH